MKLKSSLFTLLVGARFLLSLPSFAQNETPPTVQMQENASRLKEAERLKDKNKAIAKETGRVNRNA